RLMPRTFGNSFIHISRIDAILEADEALPELQPATLDDVTLRIGHYCSLLIEDGSTLQMGIGKIPDAVLNYLHDRNDLGIHTEMFSDGVVDLIREGVVNNRRKNTHLGKSVVSFCMGTRKLYDFVHENPHVEFHPSEYVNNPANISRNDRQVSINSAIEVDLSGQVVADSVGYRFYSGIGGQVDFIRGASMSRGGRPIIALPSTAQGGKASRIVPVLTEGAGVVTSRGDVHYVVTEFGIATLRGKSIRERALELIQVAHPDFRDELLDKIRQRYWVPSLQPNLPPPIADLAEVELVKLQYRNTQYFLRPLRPTDERLVRLFFYTYNTSSLPSLEGDSSDAPPTQKRAYNMVHMDMSHHLALCIVERQGPREVIHALGRYEVNESGKSAELRVWVREDKRGHGMATTLVKQMVRLARDRDVKRLDARVQAENGAMLHLLEKLGFTRRKTEDRQIVVSLEPRKG
ncbi:MAG: GNAT family N-acetyltransferase, partial [Magnetococcales bacterium]|nr:GNAT family N-acetyltransferase [Magnetococcales bacterium]